jgi:hypothetical protein
MLEGAEFRGFAVTPLACLVQLQHYKAGINQQEIVK